MRFELTWRQNPQTETCCSGSSVCSRCVWAGYTLCTVAFGTAVATTQGLYHMLARTKAQSGGCTCKRGNHTHSQLCLFHIKVKGLFPKGTWTNIFQELEHKVMLEKVPRWGKNEYARDRDRRECDGRHLTFGLYSFLLFFGLLINWKCILSWSKLNPTQKYLYHSPGDFPLLLLLQPHVGPKYTNKSTFKVSPGYVCWGSQLSSPTPLP